MSAGGRPPDPGLAARLAARLRRNTVVVGIGNPNRGDDAAGCLVAGTLSLTRPARKGLKIINAEDVPESFLGPITESLPSTVVLVDAVELGQPPGAVALLEVEDLQDREASTHQAPLSLLARFVTAESGADVFVVGIQPGRREVGGAPSPEVVNAARVVAQLLREASMAQETLAPRIAATLGLRRGEAPC
jgi:hydrogenase 3 maturation protease